MGKKDLIVRFWVTVVAVLAGLADGALAQAPFYQGKTLVVVWAPPPEEREITAQGPWFLLCGNTSREIRQSCSSTRPAVAVDKQPIMFTKSRSRTG